VNWIFFPRTEQTPKHLLEVVSVFEEQTKKIDSKSNTLKSNDVLACVRPGLSDIGFNVEYPGNTIKIPVLHGERGKVKLAFKADALSEDNKTVIEVEAGRAYRNNQFLKDIFEASMMIETDYLVLAVREEYRGGSQLTEDYKIISAFIEAMFSTNRISLKLKGILLIGY